MDQKAAVGARAGDRAVHVVQGDAVGGRAVRRASGRGGGRIHASRLTPGVPAGQARPLCHGLACRPSANHPMSPAQWRSEEHTSELQSLMRISYAVFCLKKKNTKYKKKQTNYTTKV